jgi:cation:H+ antiporter
MEDLKRPGTFIWIAIAIGFLFAAMTRMSGYEVLYNIFLFYASLLLLLKAAEYLVDGSSRIARHFGISSIIIGMTVVAFGTSLPELTVSVLANMVGSAGISIGNVVGSNISNICLVLGLAALLVPIKVKREVFRFDTPFLIGISFLLLFLSISVLGSSGPGFSIGFVDGIIMLALFAFFMYIQVSSVHPHERRTGSPQRRHKRLVAYLMLVVVGLAGIIVSAGLLVESGRNIAMLFGIPEVIIGLTMIAVGTSLPELATNIVAALKKKFDIAIGNIIGSNVFNILLILGTASVIKPIENIRESVVMIDMPIMIGLTVLLFVLMRTGFAICRRDGVLLVSLYIVYIIYLFMRMG